MTKSERLLFIVNLFRVKKRVTLAELAQECEVSKRTIYRDLLSLSGLSIPVYFDNGYRLAREISLPALNFSEDEQEIIGFSLRNSCLARSVHLKSKLRIIEMKILSALPEETKKRKKDWLNHSIRGQATLGQGFTAREDAILGEFCRALFGRNTLVLQLEDSGQKISSLHPIQLEIKGQRWDLCFAQEDDIKVLKVPLKKVASLYVSR